jgi:superfamily II DNA helicase RecQ
MSTLLLLIAPVASGKTHWLLNLLRGNGPPLVFVSPLRALAEEFHTKASEEFPSFLVSHHGNVKPAVKAFMEKGRGVLVVTPELCSDWLYSALAHAPISPLVVFDEFHLFYRWGADFRPVLWECFMAFANANFLTCGLTATMSDEVLSVVREELPLGFDTIFINDCGNFRLKFEPAARNFYHSGFQQKALRRRFLSAMNDNHDGVFLYFCQYRSEVDDWVSYFKKRGVRVVGCKGGEVASFVDELRVEPHPKAIFATTVLGHGVNLPSISKVFFSYQVGEHDFWIQMAGRGGRRGERYEVHSFDTFGYSSIRRWSGYASTFLADIALRFFY